MQRLPLPNAWYGDCRLDHQLAYLVHGADGVWRVQVNDRLLVPPTDVPLYLRVTDTGPLTLAGQGWTTGAAVQYDAATDAWSVPAPATYGVNPLIFAGQNLVLSTVDRGSQGLRYVATDGTIISGDQTVNSGTAWSQQCGVIGPLWEWSHFDGLTIGQGETGAIAEWQGTRYVLSPGQVYFIRVRRGGTAVAVYLVKPGAGEALWFDVAELGSADLPLEPVAPPIPPEPPVPPTPTQQPPQITVHFYEPLLKAGVPWAVDFSNDGDGTRFVVSKDETDKLWIEADNAAGSTATGTVRQLTVEGPAAPVPPEPQPPEPPDPDPPGLVPARCWCHPNIGSPDLLEVFDDMAHLAGVEMFGLYVQAILSDESTAQLGPNIYPNLVAHDVFKKLSAAHIPLRIEMGAVKPGDCAAQSNIAGMQRALQRVADAGGRVATITMDEPLTANQQACGDSISACADAVAAFIHSVAAVDPDIAVGWVEAWPEVAFADHATFLDELAARHALPSYWHLDLDWHRAEAERRDPATFIQGARELCEQHGITLGVLVNATIDPIPTDSAHHQNLLALSDRLYGIIPDAAHVVVQSWATRGTATGTRARKADRIGVRVTGTQDIPYNLGPVGLLSTFAQVRAQFTPTPPPQEALVFSTYLDPADGVIPVQELKPVAGDATLVTLILPTGRVFSCQPDGRAGDRDPGTEGGYERCRILGNLATFCPTPQTYYSWPFVLVGGL